MLMSSCEHKSVGETEGLVRCSECGGAFGDRPGERDDDDAHPEDRFARVSDSTCAGEGDERLAICAGRGKQLPVGSVSLIDRVDGALVVAVGRVQQADQDARVKD
jgi:hypothetical protein